MRAWLLAGIAGVGLSWHADAAVLQYTVQGLFPDGETLGGSFFLDNTVPLPNGIFGSTLTVSGHGRYSTFAGAAPVSGTSLNLQFGGQGILSLTVTADYNSILSLLYGIQDGAFGVSSLYGLGIGDMLLLGGTINVVNEPLSLALLGTGVGLTIAASRRRVGPIRPAGR